MKNIDINELQSHVQKSILDEGILMKIMRWAAWSVQVLIRWRFGLRCYPMTYITITAFWLILDDTIRPLDLGLVKVTLLDFSEAFRMHLSLSIGAWILHLLLGYFREQKGRIISTLYSGKPLIQFLLDRLPFKINESIVKRFIEPVAVFLISYSVPFYFDGYQMFLQFVSFSMFITAHKNYMYVKNMVWDIRDMEIQAKIMMNSEEKGGSNEVFVAEEGGTYRNGDFDSSSTVNQLADSNINEVETFNAS